MTPSPLPILQLDSHMGGSHPLVETTLEDCIPSEMELSRKRTMLQVISPQCKSLPLEMIMPRTLEMTPQDISPCQRPHHLPKWSHPLVHLKLGKMLKRRLRLFRNNGLNILSWFHQGTDWNIFRICLAFASWPYPIPRCLQTVRTSSAYCIIASNLPTLASWNVHLEPDCSPARNTTHLDCLPSPVYLLTRGPAHH